MAVIDIVRLTASGKATPSLEFTEAPDGADSVEIISADAMQPYQDMGVEATKIFPARRHGIVHHRTDVLDVLDETSVAAYQRNIRADVDAILVVRETPVVVGGLDPYASGLLDRLDFPGRGRRVCAELELLLEREGPGPLLEELVCKNPQTYEAMDLANTRRLVRVLKAIQVTGRPYTLRLPRHAIHYLSVRLFGAFRGSDVLDATADRRAKEMMTSRLIEETHGLMGHGLADSPTTGKTTRYTRVMVVVEGRVRIEEVVELMCLATRRLTKKQTKWFRAGPRIGWLDLTDGDVPRTAGEILRAPEATWQVCARGAIERNRRSESERGDVTGLYKGRGSTHGGGTDETTGVACCQRRKHSHKGETPQALP